MDLTRYLWMSGRYTFVREQGSHRISRTALALAPLYFVGGRFTGMPVSITGRWLGARAIGSSNPEVHGRVKDVHAILVELLDARILRKESRSGVLYVRTVYYLQHDDVWDWGPYSREVALRDWGALSDTSAAWEGEQLIAVELRDLFAARSADVSWQPDDPATKRWVAICGKLIDTYGLDTFRMGIQGALMDPTAVIPFTAARFEAVFFGLVKRARLHIDRREGGDVRWNYDTLVGVAVDRMARLCKVDLEERAPVPPTGAGPAEWAALAGLGTNATPGTPHALLGPLVRSQPVDPYTPEDIARAALRRLVEQGHAEWAGSDLWRPKRRRG